MVQEALCIRINPISNEPSLICQIGALWHLVHDIRNQLVLFVLFIASTLNEKGPLPLQGGEY